MSADNWDICPRCVARAQQAADAAHAAVYAQYGKVTVESFDKLRAELRPVNPEDYRTFREDYEIYGAASGTVKVSYGGGCTTCGLTLNVNEQYTLWLPGAGE